MAQSNWVADFHSRSDSIAEFLDRWHDKDDQEKLIHFGMVIRREGVTIYNPDIIKRLE